MPLFQCTNAQDAIAWGVNTSFHIELNEGAECDVCFTLVYEPEHRRRRIAHRPTWYYIGDQPALVKNGMTTPNTTATTNTSCCVMC